MGYASRRCNAATSGREMEEPSLQRAYQGKRNAAARIGGRNDSRKNQRNEHKKIIPKIDPPTTAVTAKVGGFISNKEDTTNEL